MIDCLIVGFNDPPFTDQIEMLRGMGTDSEAFRDVSLAFVHHQGRPQRALELLSTLRPDAPPFHNADFLWPVVLVLGSYLEKHGFSFDYVNLFHLEKDRLREKLSRGDVRSVAITTTLYVSPQPVLEIVAFLRAHAPGVRIIVGGPYIHSQADETLLRYLGADLYVISQEGEATLAKVLGVLRDTPTAGQTEALAAIPNLAIVDQGEVRFTPRQTESNPLEENPVAYERFGKEAVGTRLSLRTAKSCPFSCAFCGFPERAGKYTYLGVDDVARELDRLAAMGVRSLTFLDDTFNVPPKRFKQLLEMMIANRYEFRWNSFYRSDHGDDEAIALMAKSGCEGVFLGMESGSDRVLKAMNKTARTAHYRAAIPKLKAAGIITHANFIIGFPGETRETVDETCRFIEEVQPDYYRAQLWYADPTTPVWHQREALGIEGSGFRWRHHTMTSELAAAHVDRMFLELEGSIWLPQNGFEMWSLFYLEQRGYSRQQVRDFVSAFDAGVRDRILGDDTASIDPALVARLSAIANGRQVPAAPPRGLRSAAEHARAVLGEGSGPAQVELRPPVRRRSPMDPDSWIPAIAAYLGRADLRLLVDVRGRTALLRGTPDSAAVDLSLEAQAVHAPFHRYLMSADAARAGLGTAPLDAVIRVESPHRYPIAASIVVEVGPDAVSIAAAPGLDPATLFALAGGRETAGLNADAALGFAF